MSDNAHGTAGSSIEGWRADPFGRHEARFHDGGRWTPYVRDGDEHSLDEPVEGADDDAAAGPEILTAPVVVVEQHAVPDDPSEPSSVFGRDGRDLGAVRRAAGEERRFEVLGGDGLVVLTLTRVSSILKSVISVRDAHGAQIGRLLEQHLPGMPTFALESSAGDTVGFVRARTWVGWDIRVEDERNRTIATISKLWEGLDRAAFPTADGYVVRIDRELRDPQRALVYAAALSVDTLLRKDSRGFQ